uniref:Evasin n=1 Tax=Rhipicephalus microplus TaxID=6941 RepID=A0A6M2D984_RHIMP
MVRLFGGEGIFAIFVFFSDFCPIDADASKWSTRPHVHDTAAGSSVGTTELLDNGIQKNNAVYYRRQVSPNGQHAERAILPGASNLMKRGVNYTCQLGECKNNICITFDLFIDCWTHKFIPSTTDS